MSTNQPWLAGLMLVLAACDPESGDGGSGGNSSSKSATTTVSSGAGGQGVGGQGVGGGSTSSGLGEPCVALKDGVAPNPTPVSAVEAWQSPAVRTAF